MAAGLPFTSIYPTSDPGGPATSADAGAPVNALYPGMPAGASPVQNDLALTAATPAGGTVVWQPPADRKAVVTALYISSDTAGRVAIVDGGSDVAGARIVVQRVGANGGSSPNLVPVPFVSNLAGQGIRVFSNIAGNVEIRVAGWLE